MTQTRPPRVHACPVAEGVRVQIGSATAFAVRQESKDVALRIRRELHPARDAMERIPFLRGILRLLGSALDLLDGISESAMLHPQTIVKGTRAEQRFAELFRVRPDSLVAAGSALAALILLIGLVVFAPWALDRFALPALELSRPGINAITCAARVLGALICVALIPRLRVLNRLCMYRGALNQALNTFCEQAGPVSQESVRRAAHLTGKSDAAFIVMVLLLSMIVFALIRTFTLPVQLVVRFLLVLAIAAVINEPIRLLENAGRKHPLAFLLAPLRGLERLLTRKPHPQMVEAAVYAFNVALENDR